MKFFKKIKYSLSSLKKLFGLCVQIILGRFDLNDYYQAKQFWFFKPKHGLINFILILSIAALILFFLKEIPTDFASQIRVSIYILVSIYTLFSLFSIIPFIQINDTDKLLDQGIQIFCTVYTNYKKSGYQTEITFIVSPMILLVNEYLHSHIEKNLKNFRGKRKPILGNTNKVTSILFDYRPNNLIEFIEDKFGPKREIQNSATRAEDFVTTMNHQEILLFSKRLSFIDLSDSDSDIDLIFKTN